jgi:hypothetical protein
VIKEVAIAERLIADRRETEVRIERERETIKDLRGALASHEQELGDALAAGDDAAEKAARKTIPGAAIHRERGRNL